MTTTMKRAVGRTNRISSAVHAGVLLVAVLLGAGVAGCGPIEGHTEPSTLDTQRQEQVSENGIAVNGLSANGLSANGLSANGLSANGLSANGLSTSQFAAWFHQDPALADMVMRYVVRCAVPAGQTRSYTHAQTGESYTWQGGLGLAPGWAGGLPPNTVEQQMITACLLGHVNRHGISLPISVMGRNPAGDIIPFTLSELLTWSAEEACFFGNLFTDQGLFLGINRYIHNEGWYRTRACGVLGGSDDDDDDDSGSSSRCAPLTFVGSCMQLCVPDPLSLSYWSCTYNGVTYRPLVTRMRPSDYNAIYPGCDD